MLIGIVGVCATGKSTLARALQQRGFDARQVSQEHSYVLDLWRQFSHVDLLIFLDADLATIRRRLHDPEWPDWLYDLQRDRLRHARAHCDFYLATDDLAAEEVLAQVLAALPTSGVDDPVA